MRRAPNTLARYKEALGWVVRFIGDRPVGELHLGHIMIIRRRLIDRGCGEARVASILNALRSFLKFCHEVLGVAVLDYREVRVPRIPKREVIYLTKDEVGRFVDAIIAPDEDLDGVPTARVRFRALVEVLLATGGRISEVTGLNRADLHAERQEAKIVGKGNRERILYFTERSLLWLQRYLARRWDDEAPLFITHGDHPKRLHREDIKRAFARYRKKAGLAKPVSAHILRHTMATTLLFNGCPIGHIKEILGHERLDTTCRYYLGIDTRAAKAAHQQFTTYDS
jgi:site-specific recombinase XerD